METGSILIQRLRLLSLLVNIKIPLPFIFLNGAKRASEDLIRQRTKRKSLVNKREIFVLSKFSTLAICWLLLFGIIHIQFRIYVYKSAYN